FWQSRRLMPHLKNVKAAVMTVGGWFDAEDLHGALAVYRATEQQNPGIKDVLVMGPWYHGQWSAPDGDRLGLVDFRAKTSAYYREHFELPFFKHYVKSDEAQGARREEKDGSEKDKDGEKDKKGDAFELAEANVFETGTNQWRHFDEWPPKGTEERTLYF